MDVANVMRREVERMSLKMVHAQNKDGTAYVFAAWVLEIMKKKWGFNHMPDDDAALNCDSGAFRAVGLSPVK